MTLLIVTNGKYSVDLLDAEGFALLYDKYTPGSLGEDGRVAEKFIARLKGSSHDELADQVILLNWLLEQAEKHHTTHWQQTPVYLISQTEKESNPRYAMIYSGGLRPTESPYQRPFLSQNFWLNLEISVERAGLWTNHIPLQLPDPVVLGSKAAAMFDDRNGIEERLSVGHFAALSGHFGAAVRVDGVGTEASWVDETPEDLTTFVFEFQISLKDFSYGVGDSFVFFTAYGSGTGGTSIVGYLLNGIMYFQAYSDAGVPSGTVNTAGVIIDGGTYKIVWSAATGPGANDGEIHLFENGVEVDNWLVTDSDTHDVDSYEIGTVGAWLDASHIGFIYFDRFRWADADDGVWHRTIDFEGATRQPVGNVRVGAGLTHIFNYDNSLAAFSANLISDHDFTLFEVSGSTPALNDCVYFGSTENNLFNVIMKIGTAGVYGATGIIAEYWDGAAWTTHPGVEFSDFLTTAGADVTIGVSNDDRDFATTTINGVLAYWVRLRINYFDSWTTSPAVSQLVYSIHDNAVEIDPSAIHGDHPAGLMIRFETITSQAINGLGAVLVGAKSRGLNHFTSMLNAGEDNPPGWTVSAGSDTVKTAAPGMPGEYKMVTSFSDTALDYRTRYAVTNAEIEHAFEGVYRMFAVVRQIGGDPGDVLLQLKIDQGNTYSGELIPTKFADSYLELVDLGRFEIRPTHIRGDENLDIETNYGLKMDLYAQTNDTLIDLEHFCLWQVPIDEWSGSFSWQNLGSQNLGEHEGLQIDNGILRQAANTYYWDLGGGLLPSGFWSVRGELPVIEPKRNTKLFFFLLSVSTANMAMFPSFGNHGFVEVYPAMSWKHLRGGE